MVVKRSKLFQHGHPNHCFSVVSISSRTLPPLFDESGMNNNTLIEEPPLPWAKEFDEEVAILKNIKLCPNLDVQLSLPYDLSEDSQSEEFLHYVQKKVNPLTLKKTKEKGMFMVPCI